MPDSDDLRTFIRDLMIRFDRKMDRIDATMERHAAANRAYFERLDRKLDEDARRTDDIIAENRAQRQALFRMLDKMDNGGTAPAG
jgi:hypothetical protein